MLYNLTKAKQLIDLNQNLTNFSSTFTITPADNTIEYEAAVANQTDLDSGNEIAYRKVRGPLSGSVENDNGVYQNYFLVVRSENDMKNVDISISLSEIEKALPPPPAITTPTREPEQHIQSEKNWSNIRYMAMFLVVLGGGFLLYYFYKTSKKESESKVISPIKPISPIKVISPVKHLSPVKPLSLPKHISPVKPLSLVKQSPARSPSPKFEAKIPFTFQHKLF